jgi:hypothetical protein
MRHEITKADNYLLVVDNEYIKDIRPYIDRWHLEKGIMLYKFPTYLTDLSECKLVLSHAPLNGAPYLDGVDVLPFMDNGEKHEYTEEDILDAWELGAKEGLPLTRKKKEDLFKSLRQAKLPVAFESVDIDLHQDTGLHLKKVGTEPDKITNSEGRTEWVGKWIFEQPKPNI